MSNKPIRLSKEVIAMAGALAAEGGFKSERWAIEAVFTVYAPRYFAAIRAAKDPETASLVSQEGEK